jgi:DNA-binding PadR family transcriptional regulator
MQNYESNFTRALRSLERRGLLERHKEPGCHASYAITAAGISEAVKLRLVSWG